MIKFVEHKDNWKSFVVRKYNLLMLLQTKRCLKKHSYSFDCDFFKCLIYDDVMIQKLTLPKLFHNLGLKETRLS